MVQAQYAFFTWEVEDELQTLTEGLSGDHDEDWRLAWESEINPLTSNHSWVIEPLPANREAIGCQWLFMKKNDGRYKARLVAKGYS